MAITTNTAFTCIEEKLDVIIDVLTRIDQKLQSGERTVPAVAAIPVGKPTKAMLKFQHLIEFAARMDRTHYLTAIRQQAAEIVEIRKQQPGWIPVFSPQFNPKIDEKIQKTGAQFYKDLKNWSENYTRAVEAEGEKTLQRALSRLKARVG